MGIFTGYLLSRMNGQLKIAKVSAYKMMLDDSVEINQKYRCRFGYCCGSSSDSSPLES